MSSSSSGGPGGGTPSSARTKAGLPSDRRPLVTNMSSATSPGGLIQQSLLVQQPQRTTHKPFGELSLKNCEDLMGVSAPMGSLFNNMSHNLHASSTFAGDASEAAQHHALLEKTETTSSSADLLMGHVWARIALWLDVRSLGRFLQIVKLAKEEEHQVWQHCAYTLHLCVPVPGNSCNSSHVNANIHWKQLVKNFVEHHATPTNILRANGLDLYVCGDPESIVDRPIRPGTTLFGLPFSGQCLSTRLSSLPPRMVLDHPKWPRIRPGEGLVLLNFRTVSSTAKSGEFLKSSSYAATISTTAADEEKQFCFAIGYHRSFATLIHKISELCGVSEVRGFHDDLTAPLRSLFWCAVEELTLTQFQSDTHATSCAGAVERQKTGQSSVSVAAEQSSSSSSENCASTSGSNINAKMPGRSGKSSSRNQNKHNRGTSTSSRPAELTRAPRPRVTGDLAPRRRSVLESAFWWDPETDTGCFWTADLLYSPKSCASGNGHATFDSDREKTSAAGEGEPFFMVDQEIEGAEAEDAKANFFDETAVGEQHREDQLGGSVRVAGALQFSPEARRDHSGANIDAATRAAKTPVTPTQQNNSFDFRTAVSSDCKPQQRGAIESDNDAGTPSSSSSCGSSCVAQEDDFYASATSSSLELFQDATHEKKNTLENARTGSDLLHNKPLAASQKFSEKQYVEVPATSPERVLGTTTAPGVFLPDPRPMFSAGSPAPNVSATAGDHHVNNDSASHNFLAFSPDNGSISSAISSIARVSPMEQLNSNSDSLAAMDALVNASLLAQGNEEPPVRTSKVRTNDRRDEASSEGLLAVPKETGVEEDEQQRETKAGAELAEAGEKSDSPLFFDSENPATFATYSGRDPTTAPSRSRSQSLVTEEVLIVPASGSSDGIAPTSSQITGTNELAQRPGDPAVQEQAPASATSAASSSTNVVGVPEDEPFVNTNTTRNDREQSPRTSTTADPYYEAQLRRLTRTRNAATLSVLLREAPELAEHLHSISDEDLTRLLDMIHATTASPSRRSRPDLSPRAGSTSPQETASSTNSNRFVSSSSRRGERGGEATASRSAATGRRGNDDGEEVFPASSSSARDGEGEPRTRGRAGPSQEALDQMLTGSVDSPLSESLEEPDAIDSDPYGRGRNPFGAAGSNSISESSVEEEFVQKTVTYCGTGTSSSAASGTNKSNSSSSSSSSSCSSSSSSSSAVLTDSTHGHGPPVDETTAGLPEKASVTATSKNAHGVENSKKAVANYSTEEQQEVHGGLGPTSSTATSGTTRCGTTTLTSAASSSILASEGADFSHASSTALAVSDENDRGNVNEIFPITPPGPPRVGCASSSSSPIDRKMSKKDSVRPCSSSATTSAAAVPVRRRCEGSSSSLIIDEIANTASSPVKRFSTSIPITYSWTPKNVESIASRGAHQPHSVYHYASPVAERATTGGSLFDDRFSPARSQVPVLSSREREGDQQPQLVLEGLPLEAQQEVGRQEVDLGARDEATLLQETRRTRQRLILPLPSDAATSSSSHTTPAAPADNVHAVPAEHESPPPSPVQRSRTRLTAAAKSKKIFIDTRDQPDRDHTDDARFLASPIALPPPVPVRVLEATKQARQFEFAPFAPDRLMLVGDKHGHASVVDIVKDKKVGTSVFIDANPLLGLSWLPLFPNRALIGAAHSGSVCMIQRDVETNNLQKLHLYQPFMQLSSLSANATNDYFVASGFAHELGVFDVNRNFPIKIINGAHEHFINISRFAHTHPHLVATASFDSTCKLWDLRQQRSNRPCCTWHTGGLNVMCAFSPDDRYLLASGVDTRVLQYEIAQPDRTPNRFAGILRKPSYATRYRRSVYFANSKCFVTGATDEGHVHVLGVMGENYGKIRVTNDAIAAQYFPKPTAANVRGGGAGSSLSVVPQSPAARRAGQSPVFSPALNVLPLRRHDDERLEDAESNEEDRHLDVLDEDADENARSADVVRTENYYETTDTYPLLEEDEGPSSYATRREQGVISSASQPSPMMPTESADPRMRSRAAEVLLQTPTYLAATRRTRSNWTTSSSEGDPMANLQTGVLQQEEQLHSGGAARIYSRSRAAALARQQSSGGASYNEDDDAIGPPAPALGSAVIGQPTSAEDDESSPGGRYAETGRAIPRRGGGATRTGFDTSAYGRPFSGRRTNSNNSSPGAVSSRSLTRPLHDYASRRASPATLHQQNESRLYSDRGERDAQTRQQDTPANAPADPYVQSVRTHPVRSNIFAVLLAGHPPRADSYIALCERPVHSRNSLARRRSQELLLGSCVSSSSFGARSPASRHVVLNLDDIPEDK
ncbi:unnamed protein product [Amoebophrya sp. A120]|nr:unnamed protein product [Amoebophrya sp. A120]|eukprot:GSA120T00011321001.1